MRPIPATLLLCFVLLAPACGGGSGAPVADGVPPPAPSPAPEPPLRNFQAAHVVVGQPTFTHGLANQGAAPAANALFHPLAAAAAATGRLFVADADNHRILAFASLVSGGTGPAAEFVLGQSSPDEATPGTRQDKFTSPSAIASAGDVMAVADTGNNRVLIYSAIPRDGSALPTVVLGQPGFTSLAAGCGSRMNQPSGVAITPDGKLLVSDMGNHRVLVWNSARNATTGSAADLILGQDDPNECDPNAGTSAGAATLNTPSDVWSDGTRVVVADSGNNRVLVWDKPAFPTGFAGADRVLGQTSMTAVQEQPVSSSSLAGPRSVASDGTRLAVVDPLRHRVLVWSRFPATDGQGADVVLGQRTFTAEAGNDTDQDGATNDAPSASVFLDPYRVGFVPGGAQLLVADRLNNRVLVFRSQ